LALQVLWNVRATLWTTLHLSIHFFSHYILLLQALPFPASDSFFFLDIWTWAVCIFQTRSWHNSHDFFPLPACRRSDLFLSSCTKDFTWLLNSRNACSIYIINSWGLKLVLFPYLSRYLCTKCVLPPYWRLLFCS
jgi:hypothetical protein